MPFPAITKLEIKNKRVFLRADLNVKIQDGQITQDYRIVATLPTINHIIKSGGKVILATHLGSPNPANPEDLLNPNYSTKIIYDWFIKRGFKIEYHPDLEIAKERSKNTSASIILLENLRFFKGEKEISLSFAEELASLADLYVNDAFGAIHREHASITLVPTLFDKKNRAFGLLVENEIKHLKKLKETAAQPFVLVLGGSKVKDKVPMLEYFLNLPKAHAPSKILIGGAIANTFLAAQGHSVGTSAINATTIAQASKILDLAKKQNVLIVLPVDLNTKTDTSESPQVFASDKIPTAATALDIGPATIKLFKEKIAKAKTIFTNGTMGFYEDANFETGSKSILSFIADNTKAYKVVGGGDTVGAVYQFLLQDKFNFISTGGGATLSFLATKKPEHELPGLKTLFNK